MSSVKLVTPSLSKNSIRLIDSLPTCRIIEMEKIPYDALCRLIFDAYGKYNIILLGDPHIYALPLPIPSKVISTKKMSVNKVYHRLLSTSTATFSFDKNTIYDTFKLWFHTSKLAPVKMVVRDLYAIVHGNKHVYDLSLWGFKLSKLRKHPDHLKRIKEANLECPIHVYKNVIIDGNHRFIKAVLNKIKTIKVIHVTRQILQKCKIGTKFNSFQKSLIPGKREIIKQYDSMFNQSN